MLLTVKNGSLSKVKGDFYKKIKYTDLYYRKDQVVNRLQAEGVRGRRELLQEEWSTGRKLGQGG